MERRLKIINGRIITPSGIIPNANILISNGIITEISEKSVGSKAHKVLDAQGNYIGPGFIDIHVHGGGGSDFMDGTVKDFLTIANAHLTHGTTSLVPTTLTSGKDELLHSFEIYRKANLGNIAGARFLGMHLEGPYFAIRTTHNIGALFYFSKCF